MGVYGDIVYWYKRWLKQGTAVMIDGSDIDMKCQYNIPLPGDARRQRHMNERESEISELVSKWHMETAIS